MNLSLVFLLKAYLITNFAHLEGREANVARVAYLQSISFGLKEAVDFLKNTGIAV